MLFTHKATVTVHISTLLLLITSMSAFQLGAIDGHSSSGSLDLSAQVGVLKAYVAQIETNGAARLVQSLNKAGDDFASGRARTAARELEQFKKMVQRTGLERSLRSELSSTADRILSRLHATEASSYTLQPGIIDGKDIFTTSVYSYAPGGGGPGGGENRERLRVGGWGDEYYSLIQFDVTGLPTNARSAVVYLYCYNLSSGGTEMILDRIVAPWDWRTEGTGSDHDRLWWVDRPPTVQWLPGLLPAPASSGQWYAFDITSLYNNWQSGVLANDGIQLRPVETWSQFNEFYSANYVADPALRPKLVVTK